MEAVSVNSLLILISICAIAFFIGRQTGKGRKDNQRLEMELEQSKAELKNYRSEVTSHFQESAHRMNALTENYRNVYEHLAQGAQDLCDKKDAPQLMNDLNSNSMLGGAMNAKPEVEQEVLAAEPDATIDSSPNEAETEKSDEKHDDTVDSTTVEEITETLNSEEAPGAKQEKNTEADENHDQEEVDSEEKVSDEPIVAAQEYDESGDQAEEKKPAA